MAARVPKFAEMAQDETFCTKKDALATQRGIWRKYLQAQEMLRKLRLTLHRVAWDLAQRVHKLKNKDKATLYSL